jgi:hypothetical protein
MGHKIIFVFASVVLLMLLDQYWLYPVVAGNLPSPFSWVIGSAVVMAELSALFAEWIYL